MIVKIKPVKSKRDLAEFIRFPYRLHRQFPAWIPPLISETKTVLNRGKNPFFKHASMEMFIAQVNGQTVGRIAAIIDQNYIKVRNRAIGQFGFFDAIQDKNVAFALFNTASKWLREEGMVSMLGPTNPSMNDEIGVLIDAFDLPPAIKMVWNPPYYVTLFKAAGFKKEMDIYAWNLETKDFSQRILKTGEAVLKRTRVTFRNPNMKKFDDEIEIVRNIYNQAWSENWGFVPWNAEEFEHLAKSMKQVIDPRLILIAELDGEPVGFSFALPDINLALKHLNGRLFPIGLPKLLWYSRKIKRLRIVILGVIKKFRNRGIDTAMYFKTWQIGTEIGYTSGEMSWILENNRRMNRAAKMMGAERYKTYRIYERSL